MIFTSKKSYLGVDLGTSSVKIVELQNEKGRAKLITYGFSESSNGLTKSDDLETSSRQVKLLSQICQKAETGSTKTIAALPTYSVFSSVINLPVMSRKDLSQAVSWEAKKLVPLPLEDMILDWKEIRPFKKKGADEDIDIKEQKAQNIKILLTSAPKNLVKKYIDIFQKANLNLLSLETEVFALIRSLIGNDKSVIMIVDIGALNTSISVIDEGIPFLNRSIDVGGLTITKAISQSLNITLGQAEQFKYDIALASFSGGASEILETIKTTLDPVVNEIQYSFNLFIDQLGKKIEKVILTGGSSFLSDFSGYLSNLLDTKVYIGDPWARVIYPQELGPLLQDLGPRFAVAVGLAMRDIV